MLLLTAAHSQHQTEPTSSLKQTHINPPKHKTTTDEYWRPGPDGNDIQKTNVPNLRMRFRLDAYQDETRLVLGGALAHHARRAAALVARGE